MIGQAGGVDLKLGCSTALFRSLSGIRLYLSVFIVRRSAAYYSNARVAVAGERPDDANRARPQTIEDVACDAIHVLIDGENARPIGSGGGKDDPPPGVEAHRGGARPLLPILPRLQLPSLIGAGTRGRIGQRAHTQKDEIG